MIEVLPVQSKSEQEALCALCKIDYAPDALAYRALSGDGSTAGLCQFRIKGPAGRILDLAAAQDIPSFDILFTLGRAALNFIDLCGIHEAYYDGEITDEVLLHAIGFKRNSDGIYHADLTSLFDSPCRH